MTYVGVAFSIFVCAGRRLAFTLVSAPATRVVLVDADRVTARMARTGDDRAGRIRARRT
jgi:hypothetical protein